MSECVEGGGCVGGGRVFSRVCRDRVPAPLSSEVGMNLRGENGSIRGQNLALTGSLCWKWSKVRACWQVRTLTGPSGEVTSVDFSPDGGRIVSGSGSQFVKIWNVETGAEVSSFLQVRCGCWLVSILHPPYPILQLPNPIFQPPNQILQPPNPILHPRWQVCTLTGHKYTVRTVAFSRDGKRIVSGSYDKLVKIWNAAIDTEVSSFVPVLGEVTVAFCLGLTRVKCWRWSEMRILWQVYTLTGHQESVSAVAFSPDGKRILTGSRDKLVKIWNAETGAEVSSFVRVRCGWQGDECIFGGFRTCFEVEFV